MNLRAALCTVARVTLDLFDTTLREEDTLDDILCRVHFAEAEVARLGVILSSVRAAKRAVETDLEIARHHCAEAEEACQEQLARAERLTVELAATTRPAIGDPIVRARATQ